jgi:hypothetical protein
MLLFTEYVRESARDLQEEADKIVSTVRTLTECGWGPLTADHHRRMLEWFEPPVAYHRGRLGEEAA